MAYKICLTPSNQTDNYYASGNTTEAVQCGRIAAAAETALKRCGFEVLTVHYHTMAQKVAKSNAFGADLHVPIHTNAFNGKVSGTRLFAYNTTGAGYKACKAIYNVLAPLTPGSSESITAYPGLYEIKNANAPTAYVEVDFHDVASVAAWIIAHVVDIGEAICKGICNYFGVAYIAPAAAEPEEAPDKTTDEEEAESDEAKTSKTFYRVIVEKHEETRLGSFGVQANAENLVKSLKDLGITWVKIEKAEV